MASGFWMKDWSFLFSPHGGNGRHPFRILSASSFLCHIPGYIVVVGCHAHGIELFVPFIKWGIILCTGICVGKLVFIIINKRFIFFGRGYLDIILEQSQFFCRVFFPEEVHARFTFFPVAFWEGSFHDSSEAVGFSFVFYFVFAIELINYNLLSFNFFCCFIFYKFVLLIFGFTFFTSLSIRR